MPIVDNSQPPFDRGQTWSFILGNTSTGDTAAAQTPVTSPFLFYNAAAYNNEPFGGEDICGQERWFKDLDYSQRNKPYRSGRAVLCRAVRNFTGVTDSVHTANVTGGFALQPSRLVYTGNAAGFGGGAELGRVYGYVDVTYDRGYPIDEWLPGAVQAATTGAPSGGLQAGDIGWIVIRGPSLIWASTAALAQNITVGSPVIAQTAAASTGYTGTTGQGGRIDGLFQTTSYTVCATSAMSAAMGIIGRAMSALTTSQASTGTATTNAMTRILIDVDMWF